MSYMWWFASAAVHHLQTARGTLTGLEMLNTNGGVAEFLHYILEDLYFVFSLGVHAVQG